MFDMNALKSAKNKSKINQGKKEEDFNEIYNQALRLLREFSETQNTEKLNKATEKFFIALKSKRNRIEPYCYLSYIFYIFDEEKLALEYLNFAKSIDPSYPQISEIQKLFL